MGAAGFRYSAWCAACDRVATPSRTWYPAFAFANHPEAAVEKIGYLRQCGVCSEMRELELHHLAPRNRFGEECEKWPTVDVCRTCHERWHWYMGDSIGHHDAR